MKLYEETMPDGRLRYRVRLIEDGRIEDSTYWYKREAQAFQDKLAAELQRRASLTVGDALDAWYQEKLELGKARKSSCDEERPRTRMVLAEYLYTNLSAITPGRPNAMERRLVEHPSQRTGKPRAAATHRHHLRITQSFFRWCVRKGFLAKSPFAEVRPAGPSNGKSAMVHGAEALPAGRGSDRLSA